MKRGTSLVELMVSIAILGILAGGVVAHAGRARMEGFGELQRERALLLLEYHAACAAEGGVADDAVLARLVESLPDATLTTEAAGGLTTLTVSWRPPLGGTASRSLAVFTP